MFFSYIKTLFLGFLLVLVIFQLASVLSSYFLTLFWAGMLALIAWLAWEFLREGYREHKFYVEHEKIHDVAFRKVLREYCRASMRTEWNNLKQAWREYKESRRA